VLLLSLLLQRGRKFCNSPSLKWERRWDQMQMQYCWSALGVQFVDFENGEIVSGMQ
jgi:hypothetical protein